MSEGIVDNFFIKKSVKKFGNVKNPLYLCTLNDRYELSNPMNLDNVNWYDIPKVKHLNSVKENY